MDLTEPIDILKGVGPRKLQQLQHMGICTLFDQIGRASCRERV